MGRSCWPIVLLAATACAVGGSSREVPEAGDRATEMVGRYSAWRSAHPQAGHVYDIPLRFAKGITTAGHALAGRVRVDTRQGTLEAAIFGAKVPVELWLVDNRPAPGASALPDPGDASLLAGTLAPGEDPARFETRLPPGTLDAFEIDRIVVCRVGEGPQRGILLTGSPGAFQRLARAQAVGSLEQRLGGLVSQGAALFEREIFEGNGRTCATCHPATNNFTIDPRFIATLPDDDPLFVAERVPELEELENSLLLRTRALILENLDGFDAPGVMRGVPATLALPTTLRGPEVPFDNTLNPAFGIVPPAERTGWSGDGAPGSGSLREFAIGAVIQHFPRSLERVPGRDLRLPTDEELDALEIFQLSLGRGEEIDLAGLRFRNPVVARGGLLFERLDTSGGTLGAGKCALCHSGAGANIDSAFFSDLLGAAVSGNANFGTGVNDLAALPGALIDPAGTPRDGGFARIPHDGRNCQPARGGFGTVTPEGGALPAGLCEEDFNTPPLVEAADTAPFFHNNAVDSLEAAVAFYNDAAFNESPGGRLLASLDSGGIGIRLDTSEVTAVASFLRVLNALENIRASLAGIEEARRERRSAARSSLERVLADERDAIEVLGAVGLHPEVVARLRRAVDETRQARRCFLRFARARHLRKAARQLERARELLIEPADDGPARPVPAA